MGMCTSWWPNREANNGECSAPAVERRGGEELCQEHVDVDNNRARLGLGPLMGSDG